MFEYSLHRAKRRTLQLSLSREGSLVVKAPLRLAVSEIENFIQHKSKWIERKQKELQVKSAYKVFDFDKGTLIYQGQHKTIRFEPYLFEEVFLKGEFLVVQGPHCFDTTAEEIKRWLFQEAERVFSERARAILPAFGELPKPLCGLKVKWLKSRWGSCSPEGLVTLNAELIHYPPLALDYVIAHEMSHLFHLNHQKGFYKVLTRAMPDWKKGRRLLKHPHANVS